MSEARKYFLFYGRMIAEELNVKQVIFGGKVIYTLETGSLSWYR